MKTSLSILPLLLSGLLLGACSSVPVATAPDGRVVLPTEVLGQNALPPGSSIKPEHSLIMGSGDQWVGRVVADVGRETDTAYRFFLESYPAQGWSLISAVRGKTSLIVMTRQDRTATVELTEPTMVAPGAVVLTIAPRNAPVTASPRKP